MARLMDNLTWLQDGERADAFVLNRPLKELANLIDNKDFKALLSTSGLKINTNELDTAVQVNDLVYKGADGKYYQALGDNDITSNFVGVYVVIDNTPVIIWNGVLERTGLTPGASYYLSNTVPGGITDTQYTGAVKIGIALSSTELLVNPSGIDGSGGASAGGSNTQRFKVADAVDIDEAVSKGQLDSMGEQNQLSLLNSTVVSGNQVLNNTQNVVNLREAVRDNKLENQAQLDTKVDISGSVLQVVSHLTAVQGSQTITTTDTRVNDLAKTIIPKGNNSKFLVTVRWFGECQNGWEICFNIRMNGTRVNVNGGGRRHALSMPVVSYGHVNDNVSTPEIVNIQTLVSTNSVIGTPIEFEVVADSSGSFTLWNNRCFNDTHAYSERGTSEIIITEIGA